MAGKGTQNRGPEKSVKNLNSQPVLKQVSPQSSNQTSTKESNSSGLNGLSTQGSIVSLAQSDPITSKSIIESANKLCFKTNSPAFSDHINTDSTSQLRSTLAIGQLIASNRPTAGSRLIANEIRQLTRAISEESGTLRREIANLSTSLTESLRSIMDDDREQRSFANALYRRPFWTQTARKVVPMGFHRRRRGGFTQNMAMKRDYAPPTTANASTNTPTSPGSPAAKNLAANKSSSPIATTAKSAARKQPSMKLSAMSAKLVNPAKALGALLKSGWFPPEQVFISADSDIDSDDDTE